MSWSEFLPENTWIMVKKGREKTSSLPPASEALEKTTEKLTEKFTEKFTDLDSMRTELQGCMRCPLSTQGRKTVVFGEGNPKARIFFAGEGPGEQEDLQGRPFVGPAGELLTKMIDAMGLSREEVYIANIVKCRPPGNRNPEPIEMETCSPFLLRQIELVNPEIIVTLGKFATQTLLQTEEPISRIRGKVFRFRNTSSKLIPTFHPAYLLRNPPAKKEAWEDLKVCMKEIGMKVPGKSI